MAQTFRPEDLARSPMQGRRTFRPEDLARAASTDGMMGYTPDELTAGAAGGFMPMPGATGQPLPPRPPTSVSGHSTQAATAPMSLAPEAMEPQFPPVDMLSPQPRTPGPRLDLTGMEGFRPAPTGPELNIAAAPDSLSTGVEQGFPVGAMRDYAHGPGRTYGPQSLGRAVFNAGVAEPIRGAGHFLQGMPELYTILPTLEKYWPDIEKFHELSPSRRLVVRAMLAADTSIPPTTKNYLQSTLSDIEAGDIKAPTKEQLGGFKPTESAPYAAGRELLNLADRNFPVTPDNAERIPVQATRMLTGTVPAFAALPLGPGAVPAAAAYFGTSQAGAAADQARQQGASEQDVQRQAAGNLVIGAGTAAVPLHVILSPVQRTAPTLMGWANAKLTNAIRSGVAFAGAGEAQHYLATELQKEIDPAAKYDFDPARVTAELMAGAALGGISPVGRGQRREPPPRIEPYLGRPEAPRPPETPPAAPPGALGGEVPPAVPPSVPPAVAPPSPPVVGPTAPPAAGSPGIARLDTVVAPSGRRVEVRPEVVELESLVTSHTPDLATNPKFPAALQPRDRSRAASAEQVAAIASNLQPELLGRTGSATDGAPIVGPDGVVESGNARTLGLARAYQQNPEAAQRYRDYLASQGYDVTNMRNPVLIRRRVTEMDEPTRQQWTVEGNQRSTLAMGAAEQAMADARAINNRLLESYRGGDIGLAANVDFVRRFLENLPQSERGALQTDDGALSQAGRQRIENAIAARAYGDADLIAALREQADTNFRAIGEGMISAAPAWARMRATRPELDATRDVLEALRLVRLAREKGQPVSDLTRQGDLIGGGLRGEVIDALRLFFRDDQMRRPVSRQEVAARLGFYADQAMRHQPGPGLFGDAKPVTVRDLLRLSKDRGQADMLRDAAESRLPGPGLPLGEQPRRTFRPEELARQQAGDALPDTANMQPGANYIGMRRDALNTHVERRSDPIRRETILRDLADALDATLYSGRIKDKRVLGFYRKRIEEARMRKQADIETTAHELAHMLDDRYPEIRQQWLPASGGNKAIRSELSGVSYDSKKIYEGFAEFVRLWGTQKAEAQKRAPQFYSWFENWIAGKGEVGQALRRAQEQMHAWFDQHALDRARSKIGEPVDVNASLDNVFDNLRQSIFDDLHGLLRAERELHGKPEHGGAYETARLTRGKYALIDGALTLGAPKLKPDGTVTFEGKSLRDILRPVTRELDDYLLYAVGRSAHELMQQGRENLFTPREIKAMTDLTRPAFRQAFEDYQAWNKAILDFAQAKGIINPAFRQMWRRVEYLPFHRVGQPGAYEHVKGEWKGIKALTGGSENIRDVLQNMVVNARTLLDAAVTNEARQKIAALASEDGGARFLARIPTEERGVQVPRDQVEKAILDALGVRSKMALDPEQQIMVDQIMDGMDGLVDFILRGQAPTGRNVFAVLRGGKPLYYEVADPLLLRSIMSLQRPAQSALVKFFALPKNIVHSTIVLDPSFMAANLARDGLMGGIMSQAGFKPGLDSMRGFSARVMRDPDYREFIANGGGLSTMFMEEGSVRKHLDAFYAKRGVDPETVMNTGRRLMYGLQQIGEAFETATRLAEYKRAKAQGVDPRHATYLGREISTDFGMRGDAGPIVNETAPGAALVNGPAALLGFLFDTVPFLKAAMNGLDRYYRGLAHDENRVSVMAKTAALAGASAALAYINSDNELFNRLEPWDRAAHWHFYVPKPETLRARFDGRPEPALEQRYIHLMLPKIWEPGLVGTLAEYSTLAALSGEYGENAKGAARATLQVLLPAGGMPIPAAVKPVLEVVSNRNFFTGSPIEGQAIADQQPWSRTSVHGSTFLRKMGELERGLPTAMQVSPARAEHLIRGYFNAWGMAGLGMLDLMWADQKADKRLDEYPVLRRFYRDEPNRSNKYVGEFYDLLREATAARRTMSAMDKSFRKDIAGEIEFTPENLGYKQMSGAREGMTTIRHDIEAVIRAPDLKSLHSLARERAQQKEHRLLILNAQAKGAWSNVGALKRFLIDDLTVERNAFAERTVREVKEQRRAAGGSR